MAKPAVKIVPPPAEEAAAPAPKKRGKLVIIVVAALVLAGVGGGAAWWFLGRAPAPEAAEAKPAKVKAPTFVNLEPFTVNLLEENGDHYLQMSIVLQVDDDKAGEQLKVYMPIVRNQILLLLSGKRPSEIMHPDGKAQLVDEVVRAVRGSVPGATPERGIVGAFLGSFVIQ